MKAGSIVVFKITSGEELIGEVFNPLGDCIDVGFGLERLEMVLNGLTKSREETLKETVAETVADSSPTRAASLDAIDARVANTKCVSSQNQYE